MLHEEWMLRAQILMGRLAARIAEPGMVDSEMNADLESLYELFAWWSTWTTAAAGDRVSVLEQAEKAGVAF